MWAWDTPRRRVTPEAGYNLEEAHHTGWKPELAVLVKAMWPAKAGYHNLTCGGKEYRNIACRDRIPQSGLRRREYRNLRDPEVFNGIRYDADIVAIKRPYAATTRESSLLPESHN